MRWVRTRVLPEPAPARINSGPSPYVTASRCGALSPSSRVSRSWEGAVEVFSAIVLDDRGVGLCDDVRTECARIAARPRFVRIDLDRLGDVEPGPDPALDPERHYL